MKKLSWNAIEAPQMTLRLVPEVHDSVDMVLSFDKFLSVINAVMSELRDIQNIMVQKAICVDNAVWLDSLSKIRNRSILLGILNDNDMGLAASLEQPNTGNLPAAPRPRLPFREPRK